MRKHGRRSYAFWILLAEAVGALAALLTKDAVRGYGEVIQRPPLAPPGIVFPLVWTVLYALMGIGAARVSLAPRSPARRRALLLFWLQLAVNFFWSLIFFRWQAFGAAFFWLVLLWALLLAMILAFREVDRLAALLQIPYLLWVSFAAYLNFAVWRLNG